MDFATLKHVNEEVNQLPYRSDADRYLTEDYWASIDKAGGDCEDYAIAKLRRFVTLGWPIENLKLATCYTEKAEYHAVLIVSMPAGDYMLDSRQLFPVELARLPELGYKPALIQTSGGQRGWSEWIA